ncbi:MAG TPA: PLP-dependent aspartate aminotransferase family protein [Hyphomicrobiaceae bacterium]|nr:PLP-dependent aspartate aminotransferase family protein [Hyphomicrobiaceae bacterium]
MSVNGFERIGPKRARGVVSSTAGEKVARLSGRVAHGVAPSTDRVPLHRPRPETIAAQAGGVVDAATGAVVPPIHVATTFVRDADNQYRRGYCYGRSDNATVRQVEDVLTELELGKATLMFASGMAAAAAVFLALQRPAHIVAPTAMYWGLRQWLTQDAAGHGIEATFVDAGDPLALRGAIRPGRTRLVWIETPSNPLWTITDIAEAARIAHAAGALLAVDSTVPTPVLSRPIALGADLVLHSATKYLNGHSDVVAGAIVFAGTGAIFEQAARLRTMLGSILGSFEAALLLRGMRTLHVRVRHQSASAMTIARHFRDHPAIARVLYPGLATHPGHAIASRQMHGVFGGMLSMRFKGGQAAAVATAAAMQVWKRATSLGGVESLVEHRSSIEGAGSPCPSDLLRFSVGLEDVGDLIADIERSLPAA